MKLEDFITLSNAPDADISVSASELIDQTDRTLLYGYDLDRNTVHVYLRDGLIHWYSREVHKHEAREKWEDARHLMPSKRAYPEHCDYEFSRLVKSKDVNVPFTTYNNEREPRGAFAGETY